VFPVDFGVVQPLLPFVGVQSHLPIDVHGEGMVLNTIQRKPALAIIKGCGDGTQQPVFQEANTANAALIEIEPVICDPPFGWTFQRHASQQFEECTLELNAILLSLQLVAGKVDWEAPARRLPDFVCRN
jgi:hypothetical protein